MTSGPSGHVQAVEVSGTIEPTRLSPAYRLGLVVVASAMLLLPLLYLGIIVLAAAIVWWNLNALALRDFSGTPFVTFAYLAPAGMGIVLIFFMLKPVLARPRRKQDPPSVLPDAEPVLFAFIEQICRQVRAPVPRLVQVDCRVNASAGFTGGFLGVLRKDLVLTIGLPLVERLSVRELGGVLAHEFGHFAQGGGMRLTALVRSINGWFARVVYERDRWDLDLEQWEKEKDGYTTIIIVAGRAAIWLSRRVLAGLMKAGRAISCFMMRQMEYDADSYQIKVVGSHTFTRTLARTRELGLGAHLGYNDLGEGFQQRTLPSNLPVFLIERIGRIPDELVSQVQRGADTPAGLFDTHPTDADRARAAEAAGASGVIVAADGPATELFRNLDALSSAATRHFYEHDLGLNLDVLTLVGKEAALQATRRQEEGRRAIELFFGDRLSVYRPFHLVVAELDDLSASEIVGELRRARESMVAADTPRLVVGLSPCSLSDQYRRYEWLEWRRERAFAAQELLAVGFRTCERRRVRFGTGDGRGGDFDGGVGA